MLRFPYRPEPVGTTVRWRPLTQVTVIGSTGGRQYKALFDPGSDDTILPIASAQRIGASLQLDAGHILRWRGQPYPLRFGQVELELTDGTSVWRWPAVVAFSAAPIQYVLLGNRGCLEFMDATFRGADRIAEIETNRSYAGSKR